MKNESCGEFSPMSVGKILKAGTKHIISCATTMENEMISNKQKDSNVTEAHICHVKGLFI